MVIYCYTHITYLPGVCFSEIKKIGKMAVEIRKMNIFEEIF